MLNWEDYNRFSDFYWVCLKTIHHINFKLLIFRGHTASLRSEFERSGFLNIGTFTHETQYTMEATINNESTTTEPPLC